LEIHRLNALHRKLRPWLAIAAAPGGRVSQAQASPLACIAPVTQVTTVGEPVFVNLWAKNLADAVGAFSLTLNVLPSIPTGLTDANDPDGKMGALPLGLSGGSSAGSLGLFFSADASATETARASAQGLSCRPARVGFEGLANGLSPITLAVVLLSNRNGSFGNGPKRTQASRRAHHRLISSYRRNAGVPGASRSGEWTGLWTGSSNTRCSAVGHGARPTGGFS
jgi:hypothetical protein